MEFVEIFVTYWDQAITGFIGGLVVYILTLENAEIFGRRLKNKWVKAVYAFLVAVLLVIIYSFGIYLFQS